MELKIRKATAEDAPFIAQVVCIAIACEGSLKGYCGENYMDVIAQIAAEEGTQYSWQNALIAEVDGCLAGGIVSYHGAKLYPLRAKTWDIIENITGKRPFIVDETQAGECYLDSLAVLPEHRGKGIAKQLILALSENVKNEGIPYVGLLVDVDNERGQSLYKSVGFEFVNDSDFLRHKMYHLQKNTL